MQRLSASFGVLLVALTSCGGRAELRSGLTADGDVANDDAANPARDIGQSIAAPSKVSLPGAVSVPPDTDPHPTPPASARWAPIVVSGLPFRCEDGTAGTTAADGSFPCPLDTPVSFFLGELELGTALASEKVSFLDLVDHAQPTHQELASYFSADTPTTLGVPWLRKALNAALLLYTLDADETRDNGIQLDGAFPTSWQSARPLFSLEQELPHFLWDLQQILFVSAYLRKQLSPMFMVYHLLDQGVLTTELMHVEGETVHDEAGTLTREVIYNFDDQDRLFKARFNSPTQNRWTQSTFDFDNPAAPIITRSVQTTHAGSSTPIESTYSDRGSLLSRNYYGTVTDYEHNAWGVLVAKKETTSNGLLRESTYELDHWGRPIRQVSTYSGKSPFTSIQTRTYSPSGQILASNEEVSTPDQPPSYWHDFHYTYDASGLLQQKHESRVTENNQSSYELTIDYQYDSSGRLIESDESFVGYWAARTRENYRYNDAGLLAGRLTEGFDETGQLTGSRWTLYTYDQHHRLITITKTDSSGAAETITDTYVRDESGLVLTHTELQSDDTTTVTRYTYRSIEPSGYTSGPHSYFNTSRMGGRPDYGHPNLREPSVL